MTLLLAITLSVLPPYAGLSAQSFPDTYDRDLKRATEMYLPGMDWRLLKAQLYQESWLKPDVVSPVGARGLGQFMPATWEEVSRELGFVGVSPHSPQHAIEAAAYYMAKQRSGWSFPRPEHDRHSLAMASYNAGFGNILKAQTLSGGELLYTPIIERLPDVTGHYSAETMTYVERIWQYWIMMVADV